MSSWWAAANPLRTTFAAATARGVIGDLSAQRMEQGSGASTVDRQRLFLYTAFTNLIALVYDRPIYVHLFPRYFPTLVGGRRCWSNIIKATLVDNLITSPFLYLLFPAHLFYLFKNSVIVHARVLYVDTRHSPHCGKKRLFCFLREYGFSPVLRGPPDA